VDGATRSPPARATVVEHLGRITAYTTGIAFFAHTVGETNHDLKALIGVAGGFAGPGVVLSLMAGLRTSLRVPSSRLLFGSS
jgi:hypothetical protein